MIHKPVLSHLTCVATTALIAFALAAGPGYAVGPDDGGAPPPAPSGATKSDGKSKGKQKSKRTKGKQKSDLMFEQDFRVAHGLIQQGQYESGIAALRALDHDDHPDVANYLGYASRKLGRYDDARFWYEKALAADPRHARTWSYFGMWHAEQGNVLKAKDYLETVRSICGMECREYRELKGVIEGTRTY